MSKINKRTRQFQVCANANMVKRAKQELMANLHLPAQHKSALDLSYSQRQSMSRFLVKIVRVLGEKNVHAWHLAYGTLLGVVREGDLLPHDDDIDIIIDDRKQYLELEHYEKWDTEGCALFFKSGTGVDSNM